METEAYMLPVKNGRIGISDVIAKLLKLEDKILYARFKIRDEAHQITWVYDRLQGLTP